jgi:hypothetical protein
MTRRRAHLCLVAALALLLAPGACQKSDTILLIEVAGPASLMPVQFRVTVSAGGLDTRVFMVPQMARPAGEEISLPASFTLALDRSHAAPITISIDAHDESGSIIGFGTTAMEHIVIGGQTVIEVMLTETPPETPDAGVDGAGGATGQGGASGQGGGGQGGASGQGAAGAGGSGDAQDAGDDGMGLDAATD